MRAFKNFDLWGEVSRKGLTLGLTPLRTVKIAALVGLIVIFAYSFYAALPLLQGPALKAAVSKTVWVGTSIHGQTERVSFLEINGAAVPLNEDGTFAVERSFPKGYTAVTVSARDRFGKSITKKLTFVTTQ